jgi:hypothetical protein
MCRRNARESIPNGNRAVSWAAMILATPGVLRRLEYVLTGSEVYRVADDPKGGLKTCGKVDNLCTSVDDTPTRYGVR